MKISIASPATLMQKSIEVACAFPQYMKTLDIPANVASNIDYQKNFNAYYRIRRDKNWLNAYYSFMENNRANKSLTFCEVITYLETVPHRVKVTEKNPDGLACSLEASFSSKMLATINPDYPIWDSQVIRAVGIDITNQPSIDFYIKAYSELNEAVHTFLELPDGQVCIKEFDARFPNHRHFSPVKKLDFFLWNIGR